MKREILIDSVCGRKRLAVIEDNQLCELRYETSGQAGLSGNIYTGRVMNVLGGMNAAFVDIGLDKNGFLSAGDIKLDLRDEKELSGRLEGMAIGKMVRPGQEIMVQVVKEPGGTKGPRLSGHITIPGQLLVLLPTIRYIGISRKIEDEGIRSELRELAHNLMDGAGMGMIMRTAAAEADENEIAAEYEELVEKWHSIESRSRTAKAPALIYGDDSLEKIALRDLSDSNTTFVTDDEAVYKSLIDYAGSKKPEIRLHTGDIPLFDVYNVDGQYDKALRHHVWLKSGGYLVIDHTEALTVIDVNTGKFTGKKSHEDTIFRINTEAAYETARQLRLRDIGGIIVVDFIDMAEQTSRDELINILKNEMVKDRTPSTVVGMTQLGLVELTRKKKRLSADKLTGHICPVCGGEGKVPSFESIAWKVVYELRRRGKSSPCQDYEVKVSNGVAGALIAIGAPGKMKVHVSSGDMPDTEYTIEALDVSAAAENMKFLRTN